METKKHRENLKIVGSCNIAAQLQDNQATKEKDKQLLTDLQFVMQGVHINLSFEQISQMAKFLSLTNNDRLKIKELEMSDTKVRCIITNVLGRIEYEHLVKIMKTKKWSLLVDESTDRGKEKNLALVVRIFDGSVKDYFYHLLTVTDGSADGLYKAVKQQLTQDEIPYRINMVGYGSDGANVVAGSKTSLGALLKGDVPELFTIKCVCHSFALCASKACSCLSSQAETMIKAVYNFIRNNYKRQQAFDELLQIHEMEPLRLLNTSDTRWLSLEQVVNRVLYLYPVLLKYFEKQASVTNVERPDLILQQLKNPFNYCTLLFLDQILPKINQLNRLFQSEYSMLSRLNEEVGRVFRQLLFYIYKDEYVNSLKSLKSFVTGNPRNLKQLDEIQLPIVVSDFLEQKLKMGEIDQANCNAQKVKFLNFFERLITEIYTRFDFGNTTIENLKALEPQNISNKKYSELSESIKILLKRFPNLIHSNMGQKVLDEYQELICMDLADKSKFRVEEFWTGVFAMKRSDGSPAFPNLNIFIESMLCLPHSTAAVERLFSSVNLNKTKHRTSMNMETLIGILRTKQLYERIGGCDNLVVDGHVKEYMKTENMYKY
jgi:hypothetical protein